MNTKRKYAHELYPHAAEYETRTLAVEVPYLYARALGFEVNGTGWFEAEPKETGSRVTYLLAARDKAFLADALMQGLTGEEAWAWAAIRSHDEEGSWVWERAVHYGVNPKAIKPYPCGPSPTSHSHVAPITHIVSRATGTEDECVECCEPEAAPCCCEVGPPEFGGPIPDRDCPLHGAEIARARTERGENA